jgi:E3 ubiquitin-protein ligase NEDD4
VQIPPNVKPGEEFQVYAGSRVVRVRAPKDSKPGTSLQITVPVDPADKEREKMAANSMQDAVPDSENVTKIPNQQLAEGEMPAYMIRIPEGVRPGTQFPVTIGGQQLMVTCPSMARPGNSVRITPPPPSNDQNKQKRKPQRIVNPNKQNDKTQMFEVVVPRGVQPGHPFALLAGGVRVLVTCPTNATPGQKIRFHLPIALVNRQEGPKSKLAEIKLSYDKDGWSRTIRATDMKFQWTRFDAEGGVDTRTRFDTDRSAYVLKLDFKDEDSRMRGGSVSLVTPEKSVVASSIMGNNGEELVSFTDIAAAQNKDYGDKVQWFQDTCAQLCVEWNEGHMRMNVRRNYLLSDSMQAVMSLSPKDLRKVWRFEFIGEAGIDAGGLAREWFELVTNECFDPDMGLWQPCATNQMCLQINPASEISCPDDHLYYFRFIGRVMGKAMFDRQIVKGHMVKYLYKHILSWPIMFSDLKDLDEEYYNSLKGLKDMGADVEYVGADFTVTEETLGVKNTVELVPNGESIDVTEENLPEYMEACLKYRMLGRCEKQINELLLGFFDVIPEPLLTIFDFQELELLMCGMPDIDMDDWIENTEYSGEYDREGPNHQTCKWFWEVVSEYDHEMKARLLQFVTGEGMFPALMLLR